MPDTEDRTSQEIQNDYNSFGAGLVNHLANRYVQELFPPAKSFFRLQINDFESDEQIDADTTALLALGERKARWAFEQREARPVILDAIKHCIVTGNALLYVPPDGGRPSMFALDQYVLNRAVDGSILEIVIQEEKVLNSLDSDLRDEVIAKLDMKEVDPNEEKVHLYTYIRVDKDAPDYYIMDQSVEDTVVGDPEQRYPAELLPWIPLVWNRTRREHYGRGLVEDHYGSFFALSVLSEALVTGAAVMTDIKYLVRPGSVLDVVEMNNAATGTYHYGGPDDVSAVQTNKQADFQFIMAVIQDYRQHLGKAFLSLSSQMRDAERVTAEENRLRALELEQAHGGVFSNFSYTLQRPIAMLLLRDIDINIKGSSIEPMIVTGLDALGRSAENEKIRYFIDDMSLLNNLPDATRARLKESELLTILATGRDVDPAVIKTEEEFQAEQQAAAEQQAQLMAGQSMVDKAEPEQLAQGLTQGGQ